MNDFQTLVRQGTFVDNTGMIRFVLLRHRMTLCDSAGTGMTTFLSTLEAFLDETSPVGKEWFQNLEVWQPGVKKPFFTPWDPEKYFHAYRVVRLDFSGFTGSTWEEAQTFLRKKMEAAYRVHTLRELARKPDVVFSDSWLRMLEGKEDLEILQESLHRLLQEVDRFRWDRKTALLVEGLYQLDARITEGREEFTRFSSEFLPYVRENLYCDFFLQNAGTLTEEQDYQCHINWCFDVWPESITRYCSAWQIPKERQALLPAAEPETDPTDWETLMSELKERLRRKQEADLRKEMENSRKWKERMAMPPDPWLPRFSPNLGRRDFRTDTTAPAYRRMNDVLLRLWDSGEREHEALYRRMVEVGGRTDLRKLGKAYFTRCFEEAATPFWKEVYCNASGYWLQFTFSRHERSEGTDQKLYVTFQDAGTALAEPFRDMVRWLIPRMQHEWITKVSTHLRKDSICIWADPADVPVVEEWARQCPLPLEEALDFVPYRGGIGHTRELVTSYNSYVVEIITWYFGLIRTREEVSLEDMVDRLVRAWSGEYWDGTSDPSDSPFVEEDADAFLLFLDSLSAILDGVPIEETTVALENDDILDCCGMACCWKDLGECWEENKKNRERREENRRKGASTANGEKREAGEVP